MDIIIELQSEIECLTVEPASCSITRAVCNNSLQHVEDSCDVKLIYDPDLFAFIVAHEKMKAIVSRRDGAILFTGIAGADTSWTDEGRPFPISTLPLSIKDYTAKLDVPSAAEIALFDISLSSVITRLANDCGLALILNQIPSASLEVFVMPQGRNYRQTLDALCYQYCLSFCFDNMGRLCFFNWSDIPPSPPALGEADMLAGVRVKKSRKNYDAVQVSYNTLSTKLNEQVYFESFGYDSDNAPSPVILQSGVYFPFDAAPEIEAAEGKVYQSFASGFAETRKKYNGELEYQRSKDTSLIVTRNHRVVRDWENSIVIDRQEFESLRASVRFRNTGGNDAKLRQFAIRADATYRNAEAHITAGSDTAERTFNTEAEYVYNAADAEMLAAALYRFFSRSVIQLSFDTDGLYFTPGTYLTVDTGISGFTAAALVLSVSHDYEKGLYSYTAVTTGPAAVRVDRFKNARQDDPITAVTNDNTAPNPKPQIITANSYINERGYAVITFTGSSDAHSGMSHYSIYRGAGAGTVQKIGEVPAWAELTYIDESTITGVQYSYYVTAADKANNETELSVPWTVTIGIIAKPLAVTNLHAAANNKDFIQITFTPSDSSDPARTVDHYRLWVSRNNGSVWSELNSVNSIEALYFYDRTVDGYPEKSALLNYRFRVIAVRFSI